MVLYNFIILVLKNKSTAFLGKAVKLLTKFDTHSIIGIKKGGHP